MPEVSLAEYGLLPHAYTYCEGVGTKKKEGREGLSSAGSLCMLAHIQMKQGIAMATAGTIA